jgi:hypothetical protein
MEISEISNDTLVRLSESEVDQDVRLYCASGQRLFASRHLLPGWLCNGSFRNLVADRIEPCRTYNNIQRLRCKTCDHPRNITHGEFARFINDINGTYT